jgi:protein SCO1/2
VGLSVVLCALATSCSSGSSSSPPSSAVVSSASSAFEGAALPVGAPVPGFTLRDLDGTRVSLASYRGRPVIVAFLYSTCGPTCIVIAQQIRGALDELHPAAPVLLISAEPRADTPAHVTRFLARVSLSGRVRYLSGSLAQLRPIWRAFNIVPAAAGRAASDRSASVFLLDRDGRRRVVYQLEQLTPEALSHDVRRLR